MFFRKRVNIDEISKALYAHTTDKAFLENSFKILDRKNTLDKNIVISELIFLTIFIIDILLRSQKMQKRFGDKLMVTFLGHFKREYDKEGVGDEFIYLLNERGNIYCRFIETDSPSADPQALFKIAERFQKYCGVNNDPVFVIGVMKLWELNFNAFAKVFDKF
jgi:hypothetical protein